ncbi:MAG TPA: NAD kinase [Chitinophagales bacterium]|nr:NAD kinase [Chitinophagales bacterium]HMU69678.1 NAD kinase [Chitinophagales bacterium]HMX03996.1 NAD kinase [Chitinophagales bacterium]HMZ90466.1 NAD kinase [Chitinophagales bacterium]HNA57020.1 NAD kinase [Chitinophagales bacterium]
MHIAIYGRLIKKDALPYVQQMFNVLHERNIHVYIHESYFPHLVNNIQFKSEPVLFNEKNMAVIARIDYIFSVGGDGTLLDTITIVRDTNIPIVGINIGRLGFLANIGKDEIISLINALETDAVTRDVRTLVHLDSNRPDLFEGDAFALNEFTIHKKDSSAMIVIHTYINGEFLMSYWADGLIVSTPTGSTGYSLSCGGPIIFPTSENFVITPVAPHNLNIRPIVVSDSSVISFEIEGRSDQFLVTLDSRYESVDASVQLAVRKENFTVTLVRPHEQNFLDTLRNKLSLGLDQRN